MVTGEVASCTPNGSDLACVPGRDERSTLDAEIARLRRDNAVLKNALLEHGVPLPEGATSGSTTGNWWRGDDTIPRPPQTVPPTPMKPTEAPAGAPPPQGAPPEGALDRFIDSVERGWRRLVDAMVSFRRELEK